MRRESSGELNLSLANKKIVVRYMFVLAKLKKGGEASIKRFILQPCIHPKGCIFPIHNSERSTHQINMFDLK